MAKDKIVYDSSKNEKQQIFLREVLKAVAGKSPYRYFFYGGAIRGGKTAVCLAADILYARIFPGSRIHIIRNNMPLLKSTVEPSFNRYCPANLIKRWRRSGGEYYCEFHNGSQIHFFPESISRDKDLDRFKGLETNLIHLEQIEELQYDTFQKSIERLGSWIIDPMPPPIIVANFNPTFNWVRTEIWEKERNGKLKAPYFYLLALPTDNPYVTEEQKEGWKRMDPIAYRRFIEGDWDARETSNLFMTYFDYDKHVGETKPDYRAPIFLSFDFNVNPMTCIACQHDDAGIRVLTEWRLENSDIYKMCERVKPFIARFPETFVTGDPSGRNRNAMAREHLTHYVIIQNELDLERSHLHPPPSHATHENSRALCNALFRTYPIRISPDCRSLINDLRAVRVTDTGQIDKKDLSLTHLLDCLRYYLQTYFKNYITFTE